MLKKVEAVWVPPLCVLLVSLLLFISGSVSVNAEATSADENADAKNQKRNPFSEIICARLTLNLSIHCFGNTQNATIRHLI